LRLAIRTKEIRPTAIIHPLEIIMADVNRPHQLTTAQLAHMLSLFGRPLQLTVAAHAEPRNNMNPFKTLVIRRMSKFT